MTLHPPLDGDPGVQRERTSLAWRRTALATTGVSLLAALAWVRAGGGAPALVLAAGSAVLGSAPGVALLLADRSPHRWDTGRRLVTVVGAVVGLALAGAAAALAVVLAPSLGG